MKGSRNLRVSESNFDLLESIAFFSYVILKELLLQIKFQFTNMWIILFYPDVIILNGNLN